MGKRCLVGYTGYVGSTLMKQTQFDDYFNSSNINLIRNKEYDLVVCAAAPAVKWKANQAPQEDLANIQQLIDLLKSVKANKFILISTVDVYRIPVNVDENTMIETEHMEPYGKHRYYLEQFVTEYFTEHLIIRLPGLFGKGLKKNFIYDLIHSNVLNLTHYKSEFQFYNMDHLWRDIQITLEQSLTVVNFSSEPVSAEEVAHQSLGLVFKNETDKQPIRYDMKSKFANLISNSPCASEGYMVSKEEVLQEICSFILEERNNL